MKKFFALVLAVMMVMSLAVPAAAAQAVDVQTDGHTYNVYQVFKGEQTAADATLTEIEWGTGVNHVALLAELTTHEKIKTYFEDCVTAADVAGVLAANNGNESVSNGFANIAVKHLAEPVKVGGVALEITDSTTTVDLAPGYYLFVDNTVDLDKDHAHNPALLQVTKAGNITIRKKASVPTVEKAIVDGTEFGVQKISAMIGSKVGFQLTASLASGMGHYETYKYTIHDDIPVGMVADESSVKVYIMINGDFATKKVVKSGYTVAGGDPDCKAFGNTASTPNAGNGYSDDTCNLEVIFADLRKPISIEGNAAYQVDAADEFYVTYDALITPAAEAWMLENAVKLHNDAVVEFPNNPNWNPGAPENVGKEPPTGITPESDSEVYLAKVIVEKVDKSKNPLTGAKFKLEGTSMKPVITFGQQFVETTEFKTGETKYWLLTDGTYTDVDPATPGIDTTKYDSTAKTYALRDYEISTVVRENVSIETTMGEDGKVTFAGLGAGTYYLTETKSPAGYNLLDKSIRLVITFNHETGAFTYDWRHEGEETALSSTLAIQVVNNAGKILPETGGMGTTLFYVFGSVMVMGALVLLITKKRMAAEN